MKYLIRSFGIVIVSLSVFVKAYTQPDVDRPSILKDKVVLDDQLVIGSECVGLDCVNGENFGFDTHRLKENNLRIHFHDTSGSSSFPSNDWRIEINSSTNGGKNYFAVQDATANNYPFMVEAGAGQSALYVESDGDLGLGTENPVHGIHLSREDSPTLRLDQNGENGYPLQVWDLGANEVNFFIRDFTNGETLPFRVRSGAPTSALDIAANGNVGIGTDDPDADLTIADGLTYSKVNAGEIGFTVSSTRKMKKNIKKVNGDGILSRIAKVPVTTYDWKESVLKTDALPRENVIGLIAEEFHTVFERGSENEISGQEIQMALWLAVQELTKESKIKGQELQDKQSQIDLLFEEVNELKKVIENNNSDIVLISKTATINQNHPNPFGANTMISYNVPQGVNSAQIQIFDMSGVMIKQIELTDVGYGTLSLEADQLSSGTYTYSFIIDGQIQETKTMVKQ